MKPRRAAAKPANVKIEILRLDHGFGLPLPEYQSAGAAGVDLAAAIAGSEPLLLEPGERALVPTGLALQIPTGFEAQVRPRSGLAWRHGITVLNSPGTIDSDYRGEVQVLLINLGNRAVTILRGERIAQLVVAPIAKAILTEVAALGASHRGASGFGSTGRKSGAKGGRSTAGKSSSKTGAKKQATKKAARTVKKRAPRAAAKSAKKASPRRGTKAKGASARASAGKQNV